jgi:hypothetical protein
MKQVVVYGHEKKFSQKLKLEVVKIALVLSHPPSRYSKLHFLLESACI